MLILEQWRVSNSVIIDRQHVLKMFVAKESFVQSDCQHGFIENRVMREQCNIGYTLKCLASRGYMMRPKNTQKPAEIENFS